MKTLTYAKPSQVLPDGSSLLQRIVLTAEQSSFLRHDLNMLSREAKSKRNIRVADVAVRSIVVLALVVLGALVFANSINDFLALAIVVPLLFATDAMRWVTGKISAKREVGLKDLKLFATVASMAKAHSFNKTAEQKTKDYFTFLRTGKMLFPTEPSYQLLLEGGTDSPYTLSYLLG